MAERVSGLKVIISGDTQGLQRSLRDANAGLGGLEKTTQRATKATDEHVHATGRLRTSMGSVWARGGEGIAAIVGFEGIKKGLESVTEAYKEQEAANSRLRTQLRAGGKSFSEYSKEIEETTKKASGLSGFSVPSLTDAFTNLYRATQNVGRSQRLLGVTMDIARAKHIDLQRAALLVGKVAQGNTAALSRYGIVLKPTTRTVDQLRASTMKHVTALQKQASTLTGPARAAVLAHIASIKADEAGLLKQAKATDKTKSAQSAMAALQKRFAGQADAYGKTSAGAADRLRAAWEEVRAKIGEKLVPVLTKATIKLANFITQANDGTGAGGRFAKQIGELVAVAAPFVKALGKVSAVIAENKTAVKFLLFPLRQLIGDFTNLLRLFNAAVSAGKAVSGVIGSIGHAAKGAAGALNPFGDGIGKATSGGGLGLGPLGSGGGFGLHGAKPFMAPFAAMGAKFGLGVTSGKDDHSTMTSSGNVSYHSLGEAIDESGPMQGMRAYASFLFHRFGGRLKELISPWPEFSIKDGHPFNYGPSIIAQHSGSNAHVHVAYAPGGDGIGRKGDGLGKFVATSYGPPWGGIQGGGVTATGVNLKGNPHEYGIAVDPRVIPLGSRVKVWPNPFGYRGAFRAFDTGGAIKGRRIDFYDWRGRSAQLGWGSRSVTISGAGGGGAGGHAHTAPRGQGVLVGTVGGMQGGLGDVGSTLPPRLGSEAAYQQGLATGAVDEARARKDDNLPKLIKALEYELSVKRDRLRRVKKLLRGRLKPATRLALTQERASLIGEIGDLQASLKEYRADSRGGATTVSQAEKLNAGVDPDAPEPPTTQDFIDADIATAALTPGLDDDIAAAGRNRDYAWDQYQTALASGDPRKISAAAGAYGAARDAYNALTSNTDAVNAQTAAMLSLSDELKRTNDIAVASQDSSGYQATKYLADLLSGKIARGVVGRGFTPSVGVEVAYRLPIRLEV